MLERTNEIISEAGPKTVFDEYGVILVSPLHLREVAEVVKAANRKKHLRGLFVEQGRDPLRGGS